MNRRLLFAAFWVMVVGSTLAEERELPQGIKLLKELKFEIEEPKPEPMQYSGMAFGPNYRWCRIAPGDLLARTEAGMLKYLLDDKTINSLSLYPGPQPVADIPDEYIDLNDGVLKDLGELKHLKQLKLTYLDFSTPKRVTYLKPLKMLTHIRIEACDFSLRDLSKLEPSKELISIWIDDAGGRRIRGMNGPSISEEDIADLADSFPNLERIYYKTHDTFDADALAAFGNFKKLQHLEIEYARRLPRDYTDSHREVIANIMASLGKSLPNLKKSISPFCFNWNEFKLEPPIKKDDEN